MQVTLDISKSVEQNAQEYFEKAKKLKKKIPGIKKTIETNTQKLADIKIPEKKERIIRKKDWFEKFRWVISSDGFLVVGGRDATTNEIIIKKHTEKNDIVFHTELAGSPFVLIKNPDNKQIPQATITQAAQLCASYSKSWKSGRSSAEVYYVNPDQVTKQAKAGESLGGKGAFMIYGERKYIEVPISIAICNAEGRIMAGPIEAIDANCAKSVKIIPGNEKLSDVAKKVQKMIGGELDEIIRALPSECSIARNKNG